MKLIGKSLMFGLSAAAAAVACSSAPTPSTSAKSNTAPSADGVGEVGLALTLPGGEHISTLTYTLSGGPVPMNGTYNISATTALSFTIGSVPAGSGYRLALKATTDDANITCSYPAADQLLTSETAFSVLNRTTTTVNVNLQCVNNAGLDSGNVVINATQSVCPVWNTIVANPLNITLPLGANVDSGTGSSAGSTAFFPNQGVAVAAQLNDGNSLVLVGSATAPNAGALAFNWTSSGGTISAAAGTLDPNSTDAGTTNQTIFTCPPAPTPSSVITVTLTLSDGADASGCDANLTTGTVTIDCNNPAACGGLPFATTNGGTCISQTTMMAAGNDTAGFPYVTTGATDPNVPADFCCAGACNDTGTLASPFPGGTCGTGLLNVGGCCQPLSPCTTGTTNCVKCQGNETGTGNNGGLCSPTEAAFVQLDISKNVATAPGDDPAAGCYSCLAAAGCLDDTTFHDANHECGDTLTTGTSAQCISTLNCIIGAKCAASAVNTCYCGSAPSSGSCNNAAPNGAANGTCDTQIAAGNGLAVNDGHNNLVDLTNPAFASGKADQIFQCALSNSCTQCQM